MREQHGSPIAVDWVDEGSAEGNAAGRLDLHFAHLSKLPRLAKDGTPSTAIRQLSLVSETALP